MQQLFVVALALVLSGNAFANTIYTCEKNEKLQRAASELAKEFRAAKNLADTEMISAEIVNIGTDDTCNSDWAYKALDINRRVPQQPRTCGVLVLFATQEDLVAFAKHALMLTRGSTSTVWVWEEGGFSSADPHDPSGNLSRVRYDVPFCGILAN